MHQSISFTLSKNNLKEYFFTILNSIVLGARMIILAVITFISTLVIVFMTLSSIRNDVLKKCVTIAFAVTVIAIIIYTVIKVKSNFFKNPYLLEECNFEFYEDKVIVTQKNLKIERKWSELKYVTFGKYGICFVEKSTSGFAFIPNDAFLTDTDMTDFKESISRKIKVKRR
tara:strand:+ start:1642 stop:2154 length:513 start_codon:yes stop_codon:yes gene_type:complete